MRSVTIGSIRSKSASLAVESRPEYRWIGVNVYRNSTGTVTTMR
jgi:hypothetical protein